MITTRDAIPRMTRRRVARKNGDAWRTAVASGVKPRNLKAFGPESA